jgi:uncharacterized protein YgiM (DUF1202 family)
VPVDEGSEGLEASGGDGVADDVAPPPAHEAAPEPAPRNPRQVRARRRRRRRQLGTLLFVLVAAGVFAAAYFAISGGDDDATDDRATASSGVTTTVVPPFIATYKATTGLNVRQSPATTAPVVGVVEQGRDVTAVCVVQGEVVTTASGANPQWLKIAGGWPVGYVSAAYVTAGADLTAGKIPACPAA